MTIGPERRNADFDRQQASQQAAYQKNADMRGEPYTTQPRTPEETAGFLKNNPPAEPAKPDDIDDILRKHLRVTGENANLRAELAQARKARDAAQELLEAERQKCAKIEADGDAQAYQMGDAMGGVIRQKATLQSSLSDAKGEIHRVKHDLDTEKLLRANDASTIADLERRLKEAEGQLKAQRDRMSGLHAANMTWYTEQRGKLAAENAELRKTIESQEVTIRQLKAQIEVMPVTVRGEPTVARKMIVLENIELRRTIDLMAKTAAEVQDNFRLIAELAADPADEKRKTPRNYIEFPGYAIGNLAGIKEPKP